MRKRSQVGMYWLESQFHILLKRGLPISWRLVQISTTFRTSATRRPTPRSRFWIAGLTWRENEPSNLRENLLLISASAGDEYIYVAAIYTDDESNSLEKMIKVFDTKTQTWDPVCIIPSSEIQGIALCGSACIDGNFHVDILGKMSAYNSKDGRWDLVRRDMGQSVVDSLMYVDLHCVVENVLYSALGGKYIIWYDTTEKIWRDVKGLELDGLPGSPTSRTCVKLAGYGGKMVILWAEYSSNEKMIWCVEITLEKHKCYEIWGKVEWSDIVLTVPLKYDLIKVLSVTV